MRTGLHLERLERRRLLDGLVLHVDDDAPDDPGPGDPTVSDPSEDGSAEHPFDAIQEAVDLASDGDEVVVEPGTYTGEGNRDIDFLGKAITVRGTDPADPDVVAGTVIDCQGTDQDGHRAFHLHSGEGLDSVISGLTMRNGYQHDGGAVRCWGAGIRVNKCRFLDNTSVAQGGAIFAHTSSVEVRESYIEENAAGGDGGGLHAYKGSLVAEENTFESNSAAGHGGGIHIEEATAQILNNRIRNNYTQHFGGGIRGRDGCDVQIKNNSLTGNYSEWGGGGVNVWNGNATILHNTFADNVAGRNGGAAAAHGSTLNIEENTIESNSAMAHGGAIILHSTEAVILRNEIRFNQSQRMGGAIRCWDESDVEISDNIVGGNSAGWSGGAISIRVGSASLLRNDIAANDASRHAGGIHLDGATARVIDNQILNNQSANDAGGVFACNGADAEIRGNTIEGNEATNVGGGVYVYDATATIEDNVIKSNTAPLRGGGMSVNYSVGSVIRGNLIESNVSEGDGGGIAIGLGLSDVQVENNQILGNVATGSGGGIWIYESHAFIRGNLIADNLGKTGAGGGLNCTKASPLVSGNVFSHNDAETHGTQVRAQFASPWLINNVLYTGEGQGGIDPELAQVWINWRSAPLILNTTIRGPGPDVRGPGQMHLFYSNTTEGLLAGQQGNISEAPMFVDPSHPLGPDAEFGTADDGFQLQGTSPCIDAGHEAFLDADGTRSDVGAYGSALAPLELSIVEVDPVNAEGPWDGTAENPYQRIWEGVLAAYGLENRRIDVAPGTYGENPVLRSNTPGLKITGDVCDPAAAVIDGEEQGSVVETWLVEGWEMAGLTLRNGWAFRGGGLRSERSTFAFHDNVITGNTAKRGGGGMALRNQSGAQIERNQFVDNDADEGGGLHWGDQSTGSVVSSRFLANSATGNGAGISVESGSPSVRKNVIAGGSAWADGGGMFVGGGNPSLINNTIADNVAFGSGGGLRVDNASVSARNQILWNNSAGIGPEGAVGSGGELSMSYSDIQEGREGVWVSAGATLDWGDGMIYADPFFAPNADDYHLKSTHPEGRWDPAANGGVGAWVQDTVSSPAIDRGDPADPVGEEQEPHGDRINMGAYGGTREASKHGPWDPALPVITDMSPVPGESVPECQGVGSVKVWFNNDMLPATVEDPSHWELIGSGGDGEFFPDGTADDVPWDVQEIVYRGDGEPAVVTFSDLPCGYLPRDTYRFTAYDGLEDLAAMPLDGEWPGTEAGFPSGDGAAGGSFVAEFQVLNAPPVAQSGRTTVPENSPPTEIILSACDADGDPLQFDILWSGEEFATAHGELLPGSDDDSSTWYYRPHTDYVGQDTFDFEVTDGNCVDDATYTIDVVAEQPDLSPIAFGFVQDPGGCLSPGEQIHLEWTVSNHGPGETLDLSPVDWYDSIHFSQDAHLDPSDIHLTEESVALDGPLAGGENYQKNAVQVTMPQNLERNGPHYLILKVDQRDQQVESDEGNNTAVLSVCTRPFIELEAPFCGVFVDAEETLDLEWNDVADSTGAYVNVALDEDWDPDNGHTPLLTDRPEDPDGDADRAVVDVPDLDPGDYNLYAWLSDGEGQRLSDLGGRRLVQIFEEAYRTIDPIGDTIGPPAQYEVYSMEIGVTGDRADFRVRTDFDPHGRGGDLFLQMEGTTWAVAVNDRTLPDGREVIAGDLYRDITYSVGEVVEHPYRITGWAEHLTGESGIEVIPDEQVPCIHAEFALCGWAIIGGGGLSGGNWTMWCGNDQGKTDLNEAPDLVPAQTAACPDVVRDGQTELTYRIENQGFGPAGAFEAEVVLSRNGVIGDEDDLTVDTLDLDALSAGEIATGTVVLDLPRAALNDWATQDDPPGMGAGYQCTNAEWIGLVVDPEDLVKETEEENNISQEKGVGKDDITYFPWDTNFDGVVTPTDAIFAINRLGETGPGMDPLADPDGSGVVTPTDAIAYLNRLGYEPNTDVVEVSREPTTGTAGQALPRIPVSVPPSKVQNAFLTEWEMRREQQGELGSILVGRPAQPAHAFGDGRAPISLAPTVSRRPRDAWQEASLNEADPDYALWWPVANEMSRKRCPQVSPSRIN